jgi:hypothetical protein
MSMSVCMLYNMYVVYNVIHTYIIHCMLYVVAAGSSTHSTARMSRGEFFGQVRLYMFFLVQHSAFIPAHKSVICGGATRVIVRGLPRSAV